MSIRHIQRSLDGHITSNGTVLVALSGGVDSMVALHATRMLRPDLRIIAAHVHHGLRDEAESDVLLCQQTCEGLGVQLHVHRVAVAEIASEEGISVELAGRMVRHDFFRSLRDTENCDAVILGHHADDRVETLLHNLMRGSGIHGLGAMKEWSSHNKYLRPLLDLTKADIKHLAGELGVSWNEDTTNAESDYDRNWLRNDVIPMLETRRSGVKQSILRVASVAEDVSDYMRLQAQELLAKNSVVHGDLAKSTFFDVETIVDAHPALQAEVLQLLWTKLHGSGAGFSQKRVNEVVSWLNGPLKNGSSLYFGEEVRLCNRNGRIGAVTDVTAMENVMKSIASMNKGDDELLTSEAKSCK